jgi:hypothetical protein
MRSNSARSVLLGGDHRLSPNGVIPSREESVIVKA